MSDKFWSRKYLSISAGVSAAINFVNGLILVNLLSFEVLSIWFAIRSLGQLSSIFSFGISNSFLLYLTPDKPQSILRDQIRILSFSSIIPYLLISIVIYIYYPGMDNKYLLPYCVLIFSMFISGNKTLELRALKLGKPIVVSSFVESGFGLVILALIYFYPSLELFIYLQASRFLVKYIILNKFTSTTLLKNFKKEKSKEIIKTAFPIHLRNWIQTISQYGDKLLFPMVFGYLSSGILGMGTNFALPVIIVISSTSIFLTPMVVQTEDKTTLRQDFKSKIEDVIKIALTLSVLTPFAKYLFNEAPSIIVLYFGFWISISINLFQIVSIWFYQKEKTKFSFIVLTILLSLSYFIIYLLGKKIPVFNRLEDNLMLIQVFLTSLLYLSFFIILKIKINLLALVVILNVVFICYDLNPFTFLLIGSVLFPILSIVFFKDRIHKIAMDLRLVKK